MGYAENKQQQLHSWDKNGYVMDQRTSLHKGVLVVLEYFNNILVTYSHIKGTCNGGKFELNGLLVL